MYADTNLCIVASNLVGGVQSVESYASCIHTGLKIESHIKVKKILWYGT